MFKTLHGMQTTSTVNARQIRAFVETATTRTPTKSAANLNTPRLFPYVGQLVDGCPSDLHADFVLLLAHVTKVVPPRGADVKLGVLVTKPFPVDPANPANSTSPGAEVLLIDGVPSAFRLLPSLASASSKIPPAATLASLVADPQRGAWLPTMFTVYRVTALTQQLALRGAQLIGESAASVVTSNSLLRLAAFAAAAGDSNNPSDLPPFVSSRLLVHVPSSSIAAPASLNVMRGADAMMAGAVTVSPGSTLLRAHGNPVPFAVGIQEDALLLKGKECGPRLMRVLHCHGDALYNSYASRSVAEMKSTGLWLVKDALPQYACGILDGSVPPALRACRVPSETSLPSGTEGTSDPLADGAEEGNRKKKKTRAMRSRTNLENAATPESPSPATTSAPLSNPNAFGDNDAFLARLLPFVARGYEPAGFSLNAVASLEPMRRRCQRTSRRKSLLLKSPSTASDGSDSDGDTNADEDPSRQDDSLSDDAGSAANSGPLVSSSDDETPLTELFPLDPDSAIVFAVCEALRRLTVADLPMPLSTFVPKFVLPCLPPTYAEADFAWSWCKGGRPSETLSSLCGGLVELKTSGAEAGTGPLMLTQFDKRHTLYCQHRRKYHTGEKILLRNNVILRIDAGSGDSVGPLTREEAAAAFGGRRIATTRHVYMLATPMAPDALLAISEFVPDPTRDGPRKAAELASTPMNLANEMWSRDAEIDTGNLRRHLRSYAVYHGLVVHRDHPYAGLLNAEGRKISVGDVLLDATLERLCPAAATPGDAATGVAAASVDRIMESITRRYFKVGLQVEFSDGAEPLVHFAKERWHVRLEEHNVRNHWQVVCSGLHHFGLDPALCAERWPAQLACSVELQPDAQGKMTLVVVHARLRNRLRHLLSHVVGVPPRCLIFN